MHLIQFDKFQPGSTHTRQLSQRLPTVEPDPQYQSRCKTKQKAWDQLHFQHHQGVIAKQNPRKILTEAIGSLQ